MARRRRSPNRFRRALPTLPKRPRKGARWPSLRGRRPRKLCSLNSTAKDRRSPVRCSRKPLPWASLTPRWAAPTLCGRRWREVVPSIRRSPVKAKCRRRLSGLLHPCRLPPSSRPAVRRPLRLPCRGWPSRCPARPFPGRRPSRGRFSPVLASLFRPTPRARLFPPVRHRLSQALRVPPLRGRQPVRLPGAPLPPRPPRRPGRDLPPPGRWPDSRPLVP